MNNIDERTPHSSFNLADLSLSTNSGQAPIINTHNTNETPSETISDAAQAILDTVANPDAQNLLNDFEIAVKIIRKISSLHPDVKDIIKRMI